MSEPKQLFPTANSSEPADADGRPCHDASKCCADSMNPDSINRRQLLQLGSAGAAIAALGGALPAMAGPFESDNEYLKTIPTDKRLDAAWVRSLTERGEKDIYSDPKALRHIGMPVGGFFAGTVYLSGDGRLWLWDVFNRDQTGIAPRDDAMPGGFQGQKVMAGMNYINPATVHQPFQQGFSLRVAGKTRSLDLDGFDKVTFDGRYPIGHVTYRGADCPVEVRLEAFSPFIPLNVDDSSLPATVMSFRVKNTSDAEVDAEILGHLQNAVCLETKSKAAGLLRNRVVKDDALTALVCSAEPPPTAAGNKSRPDIVLDDFERPGYEGWTAEGTAFGDGPVLTRDIPDYQGDVGGHGNRVVNSHASAPGDSVVEKDGHVGTLTSRPFTVERNFIQLLVGGGAHPAKTCVNLLVDGKIVASVTGRNNNRMSRTALDVRKYEGKQAQLQVVDQVGNDWGNIGIDHIVLTDRPSIDSTLEQQRDFGTMALAILGPDPSDLATANRAADDPALAAEAELPGQLVGQIGRRLQLKPQEERTVSFVITWHFPNFYGHQQWFAGQKLGHWYASRFDSALAVARYVAGNFDRLAGDTRNWVETWYDSTLPYWLLDRTMANTSTLATTTCYRHADGRYWAWEGIGCCPGTCTHVWHYAQAPGRLFPEVERDQRERVDFGLAFDPQSGAIHYRAEVHNHHADDGQCGRILGAYREHQMSADDAFLKRVWPNVKKAVQFMIARDGDGDGILGGPQPNTLDAAWFGKISFTSSLYLAALKAGEAMAREMGDESFARQCAAIAEKGAATILQLFNDEYFVQIEDPQHKDQIGTGPGCYIDQVFGQTWAHWVGLGPLFDRTKQLSALRALWKYNFVPDVGPFREKFTRGRWYAAAGDAGLLMCTWPRGGQNPNFHKHWQYMYFNECMSGFEWQAAAHMIWEAHDQPDLLQYGLAISRAIHDRYNAALRNPYNEIECSDHYARAMASYGVYQAVCGLNCHGPRGHIEWAPRLSPDDFRAAFTAAEGWGTFSQTRKPGLQQATIAVKSGQVKLRTVDVQLPADWNAKRVAVASGQQTSQAEFKQDGRRLIVTLPVETTIEAGQTMTIDINTA